MLKGVQVPLYALSNVGALGRHALELRRRRDRSSASAASSAGGARRRRRRHPRRVAHPVRHDERDPDDAQLHRARLGARRGQDIVITLGSINNTKRRVRRHRAQHAAPLRRRQARRREHALRRATASTTRGGSTGARCRATTATRASPRSPRQLLTFAPGYTLWVDPDIGAEILDEITFTEQALSNALSQLVKRVGGDYLCDYSKVVHAVLRELAADAAVERERGARVDARLVVHARPVAGDHARVSGTSAGRNALDQIAPGATLLPVDTAAWYLPAGGTVLSGQQRVTYGGLVVGGGGSLVGPGRGADRRAERVAVARRRRRRRVARLRGDVQDRDRRIDPRAAPHGAGRRVPAAARPRRRRARRARAPPAPIPACTTTRCRS